MLSGTDSLPIGVLQPLDGVEIKTPTHVSAAELVNVVPNLLTSCCEGTLEESYRLVP